MTTTHLPDLPGPSTRIGLTTFRWGERTYVMGILNVTPDSFSGDGILATDDDPLEAAVRRARQMVEDGADLLDIGGESTRPGAAPVAAEDELSRVVPVIAGLRARSEVAISVDKSPIPSSTSPRGTQSGAMK